jgi:hypothetical protein
MKKTTLALIGLSASMFTAGNLLAESSPKKAAATATAPAAPAEKPQKLVRVSTINTIEGNQQFQANVQLMQAQRQEAIQLNTDFEKETDAAKKKALKTKLDTLMAKLNENNEKMVKQYGFSLNRNYTLVIETAHVYMLVSDEEAAKFEKEAAAAAEAAKKK